MHAKGSRQQSREASFVWKDVVGLSYSREHRHRTPYLRDLVGGHRATLQSDSLGSTIRYFFFFLGSFDAK